MTSRHELKIKNTCNSPHERGLARASVSSSIMNDDTVRAIHLLRYPRGMDDIKMTSRIQPQHLTLRSGPRAD